MTVVEGDFLRSRDRGNLDIVTHWDARDGMMRISAGCSLCRRLVDSGWLCPWRRHAVVRGVGCRAHKSVQPSDSIASMASNAAA
ncbi:MAG: hypothetical protein R2867_27225 [Caldilineaceae bacterium]